MLVFWESRLKYGIDSIDSCHLESESTPNISGIEQAYSQIRLGRSARVLNVFIFMIYLNSCV